LSSCGCWLPFPISVLKHLDVSSISPNASVSFALKLTEALGLIELLSRCLVISLGRDSDFSGSLSLSRALYFRISKRWSSVTSWLWQFSKLKTFSVTSVQINALGNKWRNSRGVCNSSYWYHL
jgi:hypothetical protein